MLTAEWRNTDPREAIAGNRAEIVVYDGARTFAGHVEADHGWWISLTHEIELKRFISEGEDWYADWWWTMAPRPPQPANP